MASVGDSQNAACWVEFGIDHSDEAATGKILDHHVVETGQNVSRSGAGLRQRTQHAASCGHEQRRRRAFAGDIGENQAPASVTQWNEVIPVAADGTRRNGKPGDTESWYQGRASGQ